jgi:hypothetical protein
MAIYELNITASALNKPNVQLFFDTEKKRKKHELICRIWYFHLSVIVGKVGIYIYL